MKKTLAILLAALMLLAMLPMTVMAEAEKVTIEFFYSPWASAPYAGVDPYEAYAEEKYGCDFVLTPATDFETQLLTRAAAEDMPDVIIYNATQLDRLLEQGVVCEDWTPFLEKMPTISASLTDIQKAYFTRDGKMVACPGLPGGYNAGLLIRQDWLDNLGLEMPTTPEELIECMRAFTFNDPDGNGENDTWGYTTHGAGKSLGDASKFMTMWDRDGINFYIDDDGNINHPINDGTFLTFLEFMNTIVSEGLCYPDWYTQGDEEQYVEIYNGKIGVVTNSPHHVIMKTDIARNYDESIIGEWAVVPIDQFGGKIVSRSVLGAIRTVSAETAQDPVKMDIICRYLDEGTFPNEDFFILRGGYKVDGYDVLTQISDGIYFLGKSSPDNVTVREQGSIMFGWGQMVQAEGLRYVQSVSSEPTACDTYRCDIVSQVEAFDDYDGAYQLIVSDPTDTETSSNMINEFAISFILGNKTAEDYEGFVADWMNACGNQLYEDAEESFRAFNLIK